MNDEYHDRLTANPIEPRLENARKGARNKAEINTNNNLSQPRRYHFSFEIADRLERIPTHEFVARIRMMKRCSGQGNLTYDILKASRPIVGVC